MNINAHCQALQHLLVQGFTLYTAPAAVCSRLVARGVLDNPQHAWAVYFTQDALDWTSQLTDDDPLREWFAQAAVRSSSKTPHVLCHTQGGLLLVPLDVNEVRAARMRIEAAVTLGKQPSAEHLESFSDDMLDKELKRRRRRAKKQKALQAKEQ